MTIIVPTDGPASQLNKSAPSKAASTDAFAQVMQAFVSQSEVPKGNDFVAPVSESPERDVSDEEIEVEEDVLSVVLAVPAKQEIAMGFVIGVGEAGSTIAGAGAPLVKSGAQVSLPLGFIAQGWPVATPEPQGEPSTPALGTGKGSGAGVIDGPLHAAAPAPISKQEASIELIDVELGPVSGAASDERRAIPVLPMETMLRKPQHAPQPYTAMAVTPDVRRQSLALLDSGRVEAFEESDISLPIDTRFERQSQTDVRSEAVVATIVPSVLKISGDLVAPSLKIDDVASMLDESPFGVSDRSSVASMAPSDVRLPPTQIASAVSQQISVAIQKNPDGVTELVLNPEELGRVRLSMATHDGGIMLTVTTERPETLDLMRRHIETLAHDLRQLGFDDVGFSFQGQGQEGQKWDANDSDVGAGIMDEELLLDPTPSVQNNGLDLRL